MRTLRRALKERKRWSRPQVTALAAATLIVVVATTISVVEREFPTCSESLQSLVDESSLGDVVEVPGGCVYREQVIVDKPLTLRGAPGAEIRGSDMWTDWTKSGSFWISSGTLPDLPVHGRCATGTSRCLMPEQVFLDGEPLEQVASDPQSRQFAVDSARQVVLADDPTKHTMEVTVRQQWVVGKSEGVTIEGFTMKHAANPPQRYAALNNGGYSGWTVRDNVLSDVHGAVVSLTDGANLTLVGNDVSRGGQLGVHASRGDLLAQGNQIHHNNTEGFDGGWETGGAKTGAMRSLTASGNEVYSNAGPGLWCDVGCQNVVYSNNRIHHNQRMGINFEISNGAKIFGNVVWENGWGKPGWGFGGGIVSSSSKNVEIYNNTVAWNADGISVISQDRNVGAEGTAYDNVIGVHVHGNKLIQAEWNAEANEFSLAWLDDKRSGRTIADRGANNQGADNEYWYDVDEDVDTDARYAWDQNRSRTLASFNATPGEENGRYMTEEEKDQTVSSAGIPRSPERP